MATCASARPLCLVLALALGLSACGGGEAPGPPTWSPPAEPEFIFAGRPLERAPLPCAAAVLIEPVTNTVLYELNAHAHRAPASIVKMTLELVVLREIEAGRLALGDSIRVSPWASKIGGSQAYLASGEVFPLEEMMKAIVIHSANDACVAVAEHIAGTSDGFVDLMNREVEQLKLEDTHYVNVHGLDDEPGIGNHSSAYDIAQIGRELTRYPKVLEWSSIEKTPFRNGEFILENTNHLVGKFEGLDGLKTGYTEKAGFCLCATAVRRGYRLLSVVMGCEKNRDRFEESAELLAAGFNSYALVAACAAGDSLGPQIKVPGGRPKLVTPTAGKTVKLLVSRPDDRGIKKKLVLDPKLKAPLGAGDRIGTLQVLSGETVLAEVPVVTPVRVGTAGPFGWIRGGGSK